MDNQRTPSLAARLADKICGFDPARITPRAEANAYASIADTVGVALAGMGEDCTRILLTTPGVATAPGESLIFATERRTSALDAALVNGTASHALDFDDVSGVFGGHPSAPLVAPLLALAEERGLSGDAVLVAYVVGVETETRFARAVHMHHYDKGWHPTATLGIFGAAAATARLLKLDRARTTIALAMAASFAAGIKANFGTMTKPLQVGQCARNGLLAGLLAERGASANPEAIEHDQGFFNVFNGPGAFDAERLTANWGEPLEIGVDTIGLKQFPCCGSAQPAIAMALEIARTGDFSADHIAQVNILVPGRGLRHTNRPAPRTALEAKFSVQYAVARALCDGAVRLKDFEGDAIVEPRVQRVLALTHARAHPDMSDRGPGHWGAEVTVTLKDGRRLTRKVDTPTSGAMTDTERREKFMMCAERALPATRAAALHQRLQEIRSITDMRALTQLLAK
ncbi:MAG: MmgE/PrpD family protein [Rhodospirillaceae bacterium]|nr:MAG: MmgE/PrpD family protein [Rhodospirillaceae bacterium]